MANRDNRAATPNTTAANNQKFRLSGGNSYYRVSQKATATASKMRPSASQRLPTKIETLKAMSTRRLRSSRRAKRVSESFYTRKQTRKTHSPMRRVCGLYLCFFKNHERVYLRNFQNEAIQTREVSFQRIPFVFERPQPTPAKHSGKKRSVHL